MSENGETINQSLLNDILNTGSIISSRESRRSNKNSDESKNSEALGYARNIEEENEKNNSMDIDHAFDYASSVFTEEQQEDIVDGNLKFREFSKIGSGMHKTNNKKIKKDAGLTNLIQNEASNTNYDNEQEQDNRFSISANQAKAIQKWGSLVEFLGKDVMGDKIAKKMIEEINHLASDKIAENSRKLHKFAVLCKADRQNVKQYFKGDDWVCCVTASGVFTGDEAIFYKRDEDRSFILKVGSDPKEMYDITHKFNVVHEYRDGITQEDVQSVNEGENNA